MFDVLFSLLTFPFNPNFLHRKGCIRNHGQKRSKSKDSSSKCSKHTKWLGIENQNINRQTDSKHEDHQQIPPLVMGNSEASWAKKPREELGEDDGINKVLTGNPIDNFIIFKFRDNICFIFLIKLMLWFGFIN